MSVFEY